MAARRLIPGEAQTLWRLLRCFNRREDNIFGIAKTLGLLSVPEETEVNIPVGGCIEV